MVNKRTVTQLQAAILEAVPGRAQRARLLEGLSRVTGNRAIVEAMASLLDREQGAGSARSQQRKAPATMPDLLAGIKARLVSYTRAEPEVHITLGQKEAANLLRELEATARRDASLQRLVLALRSVVPAAPVPLPAPRPCAGDDQRAA